MWGVRKTVRPDTWYARRLLSTNNTRDPHDRQISLTRGERREPARLWLSRLGRCRGRRRRGRRRRRRRRHRDGRGHHGRRKVRRRRRRARARRGATAAPAATLLLVGVLVLLLLALLLALLLLPGDGRQAGPLGRRQFPQFVVAVGKTALGAVCAVAGFLKALARGGLKQDLPPQQGGKNKKAKTAQ